MSWRLCMYGERMRRSRNRLAQQALHAQLFPIDYEDVFFSKVCHNQDRCACIQQVSQEGVGWAGLGWLSLHQNDCYSPCLVCAPCCCRIFSFAAVQTLSVEQQWQQQYLQQQQQQQGQPVVSAPPQLQLTAPSFSAPHAGQATPGEQLVGFVTARLVHIYECDAVVGGVGDRQHRPALTWPSVKS